MRFQSRRGTLAEMGVGDLMGVWAEVLDIAAPEGGVPRAGSQGLDSSSAAFGLRLMEMGLVPGTRVRVVSRAPWGCPLRVELRGYHLSLRKDEAARVRVEWAQASAAVGEAR